MTTRNTRVHVIDDNDVVRSHLMRALQAKLPGHPQPEIIPWKSVKQLSESWESRTDSPCRHDIAVCDLFDVTHYDEDPPKGKRAYKQLPSSPYSVKNIKRASLDNIDRFFPRLVEHELKIIVFSYVFTLLRDEVGDEQGANELKEALIRCGVEESHILEKKKLAVKGDHLKVVASHVAQMLEAP